MRFRIVVLISLTLTFSAIWAGSAVAAMTQIGNVPSSASGGGGCTTALNCTFFQANEDAYKVPSDGVITQFSIEQGSIVMPGDSAQLKIFRPLGGGLWLVSGQSAVEPLYPCPCGAIRDILPAHVSVKAGEMIGVKLHIAGNTKWTQSGVGSQTVAEVSAIDADVGTTLAPINLIASVARLNLDAVVEPDADGDGYGDESQDLCPGEAAHSDSPCSGYTIGSRFDLPATAWTDCSGPPACLEVPWTASGRTVVALTDGVIVRWRMYGGGVGDDFRLKVLRPEGPDFRVTAMSSTFTTGSTFGILSSPTRLPVKAADRIGVESDSGHFALFQHTGAGDWFMVNPSVGLGALASAFAAGPADFQLLLGADIEADVDRDGYGDETQDACPTDPTEQGACPKPVISVFKFTPSKFRVQPRGAAVARAPKRGSQLKITLSKASSVQFTVNLKATGSKVGKRCVKRTDANRRRRRCTFYSRFWSFTRDLPAGTSSLAFSGKMQKGARSQVLPAGSYVVGAYPSSSLSHVGGDIAKAKFRIVGQLSRSRVRART